MINTLHVTTNVFASVSLVSMSIHDHSLVTSLDIDLHSRGAFVQEFVSNPLLIDERWDRGYDFVQEFVSNPLLIDKRWDGGYDFAHRLPLVSIPYPKPLLLHWVWAWDQVYITQY